MADRRMFSKGIVNSDEFLDLSSGAKALYLMLNMAADDEGFVNGIKGIMRLGNIEPTALEELICEEFIICFPSGVAVIRHWNINNMIRKDRQVQTQYQEERELLTTDASGAYCLLSPHKDEDTPHRLETSPHRLETSPHRLEDTPHELETSPHELQSPPPSIDKYSIDKSSVEKESKEKENDMSAEVTPPADPRTRRFLPPSVDEVRAYCTERQNGVDAEQFVDFYSSKGWKIGREKMKDWKAAVRTWEKREDRRRPGKVSVSGYAAGTDTDYDALAMEMVLREFGEVKHDTV